jgi:hypothetical protein
MSALSNYAEAELLDHLLAVGAFTAPTNVYAALSTADPLDTGAGIAEPAGGAYARQAVTFNAATGDPTECNNNGDITFPTATASWGTITHFALFDAVSGGNMLVHGALTSSRAVGDGDTFRFLNGNLKVRLA